ncbi:protransforming growth factor alpha [Salarias fasciatus]|uniref:protransforming growth factor alpha n=1 Tax=Salarias fasciatus TaxID=181472 RepID=UPI001176FD55|nr:proheparin-binding EGF-like growth factor [Salarias fasciatus]
MMTRIFWDTVFLISGSLFTFGVGQSSSTIIEANLSIDSSSTAASHSSSSSPVAASGGGTTVIPAVKSSIPTFGAERTNSAISNATVSISNTSTAAAAAAAESSPSSAPKNSSAHNSVPSFIAATTDNVRPAKKFVAAAVRFHFDDCPDTHRHFCFHGTCRFLILEETPACVCHPGFVGMRCEHADLLAVVATNHRQQTVATVLVLCVIGCVLVMVLCTLLHCWWRRDCRRRSHARYYITEKHGASCCPSESVV